MKKIIAERKKDCFYIVRSKLEKFWIRLAFEVFAKSLSFLKWRITIRFRRSSNYKLLIERNELQSLSLMMNAGFHSSEPRNLETEIRMLNAIEQIARVQLSGKDVQRLNQDIFASFPILKIDL